MSNEKPAKTEIVPADPNAVARAATLLGQGELVAFPTETVYGLGADAMNDRAVAQVFAVKRRPRFNPLIIHVGDRAGAQRLGLWNERAERLARAFWPGALTLILSRRPGCALSLLASAGLDSVALRVPAHPVAQALLQAFGGPIAAPSANRSGRVSPTTAAHVAQELRNAVALILDGGRCPVGLESTIVDGRPERAVLLRPGGIPRAAIEAVIGPLGQRPPEDGGRPRAPGGLESHYAPGLPLRLHATAARADEALLAFGPVVPGGAGATLNLSPTGDLAEAGANLFAFLRALDRPPFKAIAVMTIPDDGLGEAINDRLARAAAPRLAVD